MNAEKRTDDYVRQDVNETLANLEVDAARGLSDAEVRNRLTRYGYNEIEEKEEPLWHRVFRRFWGPIPWMIELAALLSAVVQKWEDFVIITIMLLVNAGLDFFQERQRLVVEIDRLVSLAQVPQNSGLQSQQASLAHQSIVITRALCEIALEQI